MVESSKKDPLLAASLAFSVLLVAGVLTFAGPCVHDDGTSAACLMASQVLVATGVLAALASLVAFVVRPSAVAGALALVAAVAGAFAVLAPGNIFGLCMMQTMHCWTTMRPFALVCGAALAICALVAAFRLFRRGKGDSR